MHKTGVLLTNTGTPDAPTPAAVRHYLREFLSDQRVIKIPRLIWLPILYGLVLTTRPQKSAKLYQKIWTAQGSPMRVIMQKITTRLQSKLHEHGIAVEIGMNYGYPSIQQSLENLRKKNLEKIIVLPLYPQYSNTSSAAAFDRVTAALKKWPAVPHCAFVQHYADNHHYIQALATSIRKMWQEHGMPEQLLISFHGIPERFVKAGDPYQHQCEETVRLLVQELQLPQEKWTLCYQSQFGYDKWLKPSTQQLFTELPKRGIKHIDVICPGFSVDCLETLEEIAIRGKETFLAAGGQSLRYIPGLNDSDQHIDMLARIITEHV